MWRAEDERRTGTFVALAAALIAVTLSRESRLEPSSTRPLPAPAKSGAPAPVGSASSFAKSAELGEPPASPARGAAALSRFYQALGGLETKTRQEHVRILWLGDSHTAADYMTGAVRRRLQLRFGAGGPGWVRLGAGPYRLTGVKVAREGRWRIEPEPPSRRTAEGDTSFGFSGLRAVPVDARARVEARVGAPSANAALRYELLFELPSGASFRVTHGSRRMLVNAKTAVERVTGSPLLRLRWEGPASEALELDSFRNQPRLYGAIIEGTQPGVVLDTSGIDGARFATALAWDADVLAAEVLARRPHLLVVAYGTNEAFDNRRAERAGEEAVELVSRLRRGAPDADCLVVGPPDAALPDFTSLPRVAELDGVLERAATRAGCGYFSLRQVMGGDGGFLRWLKETPPLARGDRVHLAPAGYERLGDALGDGLLAAYEKPARR